MRIFRSGRLDFACALAASLPFGFPSRIVAQDIAKPSHADPGWATDPVWYDGLVEKATYEASRVIYGRPRAYEAIFLTNKERHDPATLTKARDHAREDAIEVWKHNAVEVVPTPNYDYKFVTTTHVTTDDLSLTRLDCSTQEFCGTSFKQYQRDPEGRHLQYWSFSYMPESGRVGAAVSVDGSDSSEQDTRPLVAFNALPLVLRDYDFRSRFTLPIRLLPDQTSNRATPYEPIDAEVSYVEGGDDAHVLRLTANGQTVGTFRMATDRLHVMLAYEGTDGQTYRLKSLERTDYWTTNGR